MGTALSVGAFQVTLTNAEPTEYPVEPPGNIPGAENPQIGSVVVRALKGNTGIIYVGAKGVTKTTGFELAAGDALNVDVLGLGNLWAIGTKAGDKLCVFFTGP